MVNKDFQISHEQSPKVLFGRNSGDPVIK